MVIRSGVLSTQYLVLTLIVLIACARVNDDGEALLNENLRAVINGETDEIHVADLPIRDTHLRAIAAASPTRVLLIDHAESQVGAGAIGLLKKLPKLEHFRFRGSGIDDDAMAEIAQIKSLKVFNVPQGEFTDAGLERLKELPELLQFRFGSSQVTDVGIKALADFPALLRLHLIDVPITDEGLKKLAKIERLESLYIDGGTFTDEAVDELFRARPKLHVHLNQEHHDRDPGKHAH